MFWEVSLCTQILFYIPKYCVKVRVFHIMMIEKMMVMLMTGWLGDGNDKEDHGDDDSCVVIVMLLVKMRMMRIMVL